MTENTTSKNRRQFIITMEYQPSETKLYRPISFRYAFSQTDVDDPRRLEEERIEKERRSDR